MNIDEGIKILIDIKKCYGNIELQTVANVPVATIESEIVNNNLAVVMILDTEYYEYVRENG